MNSGNQLGFIMSRPTKYKETYPDQARKLCAKGFTDKDMADFFEVSESTINEWKLKHESFSESIKEGKESFDTEKVEETLLKRALGYEATESKIEQQEGSPTKKTMTKKHIPPSDTALIFWLKNRSPAKWRDKQETQLSGVIGSVSYSPEDYAKAQGNLESKLNDLD